MTDAVEIALIGAGAVIVPSMIALVGVVYSKKASDKTTAVESKVVALDIKVDGRLTQLLAANKTASHAEGRQDERDSHSITVEGVPANSPPIYARPTQEPQQQHNEYQYPEHDHERLRDRPSGKGQEPLDENDHHGNDAAGDQKSDEEADRIGG
jgi:outer membrane murein-binding lipoprotein Lpp